MNTVKVSLYEFETQRKIIPLRPTWEDYERAKKEINAKNISREEKNYQLRYLIDELGI